RVEVIAIEYPPFLVEKQPGQGTSFEYLNRSLVNSNIEIVPVFVPPGRAKYLMERDGWHASFLPPATALSSVQLVSLQDAHMRFGLLRRHQEGRFVWSETKELAGKTVAVTRTGRISGYYSDMKQNGMELFFVNDMQQAVRLLMHKRVDYVLTVEETGWYVVDSLGMDRKDFQFSDSSFDIFDYHIHVNTQTPEGRELARALTAR